MNINNALEKVSSACRLRHLSWRTEECYVGHIRRYAEWLKTNPDGDATAKMRGYLTAEAKRDVAASTQNQTLAALLALYAALNIPIGSINAMRAKRPARIRDCPSRADVLRLLECAQDTGGHPTKLIIHLLYACGLRVTEPLNLRLRDVMIEDSRLLIRGAKGDRDRMVAIPCQLAEGIRQQMRVARAVWQAQRDVPVALPGLLARKYPSAPFAVQWAFLFPAQRPTPHPRTGKIVRWRCHEANVQRCVRAAVKRAGIEGAITPHCLRHGFAQHSMEDGAQIRDVQTALGHAQIQTTAGYLHPEIARIPNLLDRGNVVTFPAATLHSAA